MSVLGIGVGPAFGRAAASIIPDIVYDGNTKAWYDYQDLTTITVDGAGRVFRWNDKLGSGHDLIQANGADMPLLTATGVLFDGVSEVMRVGFLYSQPEQIYMAFRQVTFTATNRFFDGFLANTGRLDQSAVSPNIYAIATAQSADNPNLAINTFGILRLLFSGASSSLQINETIATLWDCGGGFMNGCSIGSYGGGGSFGNIEVKEIFLRIEDTAPNQTDIYNYINVHNELGL